MGSSQSDVDLIYAKSLFADRAPNVAKGFINGLNG